jgi:gliding motility-associated-like protein
MQGQPPIIANAGADQKICPGLSVGLGGNPTGSGGVPPLSYSWYPTTGLSNANVANPTAYPNVTTKYVVTVISANGETKRDTITIFIYNAYLNAGHDTTIQQGQTITMHAQTNSGLTGVFWTPVDGHIYNQNTLSPDVFPASTTIYTVTATYSFNGNVCTVYDDIKVIVIKSSNLFFYNTFTPNGDGSNDFFYIGNIEQYPDNVLEIYNRYGQKVFTKTGYLNDWDGKYLNDELPGGTYFYVLDTKSSTGGKHKGSVTIVR